MRDGLLMVAPEALNTKYMGQRRLKVTVKNPKTASAEETRIDGVLFERRPAGEAAPVVFDSPHSGSHYPDDFDYVVPLWATDATLLDGELILTLEAEDTQTPLGRHSARVRAAQRFGRRRR